MANPRPHRAAIYVRVSTHDQEVENQLEELRRFVEARGWEAREYLDEGVSGALEQRPALNALVRDAKRRRFDGYCQLKQNRPDWAPACPSMARLEPIIWGGGSRSSFR